MKGLPKKGLFLLIVVLVVFTTMGMVSAKIESLSYRLKNSNEYMDKTYVFRLDRNEDDSYVNGLCAEYSAPTFDAKRGLIDWVDFGVYNLEEKFEKEKAGRIRSIITKAGPHLEQSYVIGQLQESLGIMDVQYEQVVSAVQYAIWYYTDDLEIVPSSENGYDIYTYLIGLPPTYRSSSGDLIRLNLIEQQVNAAKDKMTIAFQYDSNNTAANLGHRYSIDIEGLYDATEQVQKQEGVTTVTVTMPITSVDVSIDFDVIVEGQRDYYGDVYAYAPDEVGSVQAMVAYASYDVFRELDDKTLGVNYTAYGLRIDNDSKTVLKSYEEGLTASLNEIEQLNPHGKAGFDFVGWYYYGTDNKVTDAGIYMDGPKHIVARYSRVASEEDNDPEDNNPEDNNPEDNNPEDNNPDETIDDDDIPEGTPENPFNKNPDDPSPDNPDATENPNDDPIDIPDEDTPKSIPEDFNPSYPEGFTGEGKLFYYINRFAESGGVPFIIFFLLGVLALFLGFLVKHQQKREVDDDEEETVTMIDGEAIRSSRRKKLVSKTYNENPFEEDDHEHL